MDPFADAPFREEIAAASAEVDIGRLLSVPAADRAALPDAARRVRGTGAIEWREGRG